MKAWEDMTQIERMRLQFSDLHKALFDVRPDEETSIEVAEMSDADFSVLFHKYVDML